MGPDFGRRFGGGNRFFSVLDQLQEPGHVLIQHLHDLLAFIILLHLPGREAVDHIPVVGSGHDHFGIADEFIQTGDVVVLRASDKYELLAIKPLGEKSYATAAIADDTIYFRTVSHLISVGGK
ncbi:MAG: hypothetical protein K9M45_00495 [Kiritimatiellales bacterium]|nr:hypothetical protein [Kiritimatiellales bacterium]